MRWPKLRVSEWLLLAFFAYIVVASHWFPDRPNLDGQPIFLLAAALAAFSILAWLQSSWENTVSIIRDFLPIALTLIAFREMELFLPMHYDHHLETKWIQWDRIFLYQFRVRPAIESLGRLIPSFLEFCYLLVYGLPGYCLAILYTQRKRAHIDRFLAVYLVGTLTAYALFPYFPTQPPRVVFPGADVPSTISVIRRLNMAILNAATIHVGVFPSAHVSSAFAAVWGMLLTIPCRKMFGWILLAYAASVSIATIYGRYHYAVDVLAGIAVSFVAGAWALVQTRTAPRQAKAPVPL
jgi:membrane-associated phospholipid phosphatase